MTRLLLLVLLVAAPAVLAPSTLAQPAATDGEPVDTTAISFFKAEATDRGQVMDHALWLTDMHGGRLTGSPELDAALDWAEGRFESWGYSAEQEPWGEFGRGWQLDRFSMQARVTGPDVAAQTLPIFALPKAWSPSIGTAEGEVVVFNPEDRDEMEAFRGMLGGKVVLMGDLSEVEVGFEPIAVRKTDEELLKLANASGAPGSGRRYSAEQLARYRFRAELLVFVLNEGPLAILEPSNLGGTGSIRVMSAAVPAPPNAAWYDRPRPWQAGAETIPQFVLMDEHYNRLVRLVEGGQDVRVDIDYAATFIDDSPIESNVIAEIPGTDPEIGDEIVMVGAHIDGWHGGTGATDNGSGTSVAMEVGRLLKAYYDERGEGPRRTIRIALWTGEEQGLYGSLAYVGEHFVEREGRAAVALKPDYDKFSAYYNLDNGTGRIRGVHLQRNQDVGPIFRAWLDAFDDETAQTLTISPTGGTDHQAFDGVGLPGFQFIQDGVAYFKQTWHGSMDTFDHLVEDDLEQAAALIATFAYHTAERDEKLPRKPFTLAPRTGSEGTN
ncbi:MAG: M28 family peptidase [Bacteroidota bacterium]